MSLDRRRRPVVYLVGSGDFSPPASVNERRVELAFVADDGSSDTCGAVIDRRTEGGSILWLTLDESRGMRWVVAMDDSRKIWMVGFVVGRVTAAREVFMSPMREIVDLCPAIFASLRVYETPVQETAGDPS